MWQFCRRFRRNESVPSRLYNYSNTGDTAVGSRCGLCCGLVSWRLRCWGELGVLGVLLGQVLRQRVRRPVVVEEEEEGQMGQTSAIVSPAESTESVEIGCF